jgi:hypothetical protein
MPTEIEKAEVAGRFMGIAGTIALLIPIGGCIYGRSTYDTNRIRDTFARDAIVKDVNNDGLVDICLQNTWYLSTTNGFVRPNELYH